MGNRSTTKFLTLALALPLTLGAQKFYGDDPLLQTPAPMRVESAAKRALSDYFDFAIHTFGNPAEKQPKSDGGGFIPAAAVNTLGEVPNSAWFTNRIGARSIGLEEIVRGPRRGNAPAAEGKWTIVSAKTEGISPGFMIEDGRGRLYLLKFDPVTNPEMASGADVLGALFFHALGYNVPENYIVEFYRDKLVVGEKAAVSDRLGRSRAMTEWDIEEILERVPSAPDGKIRGMASLFLSGKSLGPFRYHGTRSDDPNDVVLHEHRRDLRGMFVFAAWLAHDDSRAINTLDMLVEEGDRKFIKHHLIDFGSTLGSASEYANPVRGGYLSLFAWKPMMVQMFSLGLYVPKWARIDYPDYPSIGRIEYEHFEPEEWKGEYRNPAFQNHLPDDAYWAAKKVMAFSDEQIRAVVAEGRYSDPEAEEYLATCIIERRDKVGSVYLGQVLPLDEFAVRAGKLEYEDLAVRYGFLDRREVSVSWSRFDNAAETHEKIEGATETGLPREALAGADGAYFAARFVSDAAEKTVTVYLRKRGGRFQVVGIDRAW